LLVLGLVATGCDSTMQAAMQRLTSADREVSASIAHGR